MAQGSDGPGKGCNGQTVLVACLGIEGGRMASCAPLDYACMCQIQADVLQCYDQCPKDILRTTEQSKLTAYCVAASAAVTVPAATSTLSTFVVESTSASQTEDAATPDATETSTEDPSSTESANGSASSTGDAHSAAAHITWMCASSLLAVLTAAFMTL